MEAYEQVQKGPLKLKGVAELGVTKRKKKKKDKDKAKMLEAMAGHRSPAHSLSHSPPCGLPQQMLLISVLNHGTWVSKHVACGISLVGTPGLRTPNARCDQGPVPTDVV
ncbi:similar to RIKEN cDNA 2510049I19 (predicted), isoform CRA_a [Rattus norvegicus]|uniref:Similar to RIKEN cDNA 2510049I19 (Predicted), isoform CRA_a n=1 Tax=Rattus norvegicus TaxID=10116 RepID=A6K9P9_RAT|nr:similar to RIKEN cDNA 2510049I19 (predicted), isoform CRA_a [Rattus norvegicus]